MKKSKRNFLIFIVIAILVFLLSILLYKGGLTNDLKASVNDALDDNVVTSSDYPVIDFVINSSGEKLVNTDVAITVNVSSKYKITEISYSLDKKNWNNDVLDANYGTNATAKIVFNETMNSKIYIKAKNEKGYESYYYETLVNIDKEKPLVNVSKKEKGITIVASDNVLLTKVQYSNDGINWTDEMVEASNKIGLNKEVLNYKYVRVVDEVGNISNVLNIN